MGDQRDQEGPSGLERVRRSLAYRARRVAAEIRDRLSPREVVPPGEAGQTIWLHVGAHKTGSTTLQYLLRQSTDELARQSIAYERGGYELGRLLKERSPLPDDELTALSGTVGDGLDGCGARIAIASNESFMGDPFDGYASVAAIASDLRTVFGDRTVHVVALVRRQDDFVASLYQQHVKEGGAEDAATFLGGLPTGGFDWNARLAAYDDAFGAENVHTLSYETIFADARHAVSRTFADLGVPFELPVENVPRRNPSLSASGLRILAAANEFLSEEERRRLRRVLQENFARDPDGPPGVLTPAQRAAIRDDYRVANERLFATRLRGDPAESYYREGTTT